MSPPLVQARPATQDDAAILSGYYRDAYTPRNGGDARNHYPFVQLLDARSLRAQIRRPDMSWFVAEMNGRVIGSVGVVRNVGAAADRIAEFIGLVVDRQARGRGAARTMLATACQQIQSDTDVMLAETRTADPGGWSAFRSCGFEPIGFEPYAHRTPAGAEPMLFLGKLSERLAVTALAAAPSPAYPGAAFVLAVQGLGADTAPTTFHNGQNGASAANARRLDIADESLRRAALMAIEQRDAHASGVVSLDRYEGNDPGTRRYEALTFVGRESGEPVAYARVAIDRRDRRARIVALPTSRAGVEAEMLELTVAELCKRPIRALRTLVIDVRSDAVELSRRLEHLWFFPTIHYPQLVAHDGRRVDVLQWTRLRAGRLNDAVATATEIPWPRARRVIAALTPTIAA